jgi:hypothetical protein
LLPVLFFISAPLKTVGMKPGIEACIGSSIFRTAYCPCVVLCKIDEPNCPSVERSLVDCAIDVVPVFAKVSVELLQSPLSKPSYHY